MSIAAVIGLNVFLEVKNFILEATRVLEYFLSMSRMIVVVITIVTSLVRYLLVSRLSADL